MPYNETKIEITAPPARVREVLLDFPAYKDWHTEWIKSVEVQETDKPGNALSAGDKVQVNIEGFKFVAEVKENSESLFSWQGPPVFTVSGLHKFHLEPAQDGATTVLTQSESSKGLLSFLFSPYVLGKKMQADWNVFNKDLKARAEAS